MPVQKKIAKKIAKRTLQDVIEDTLRGTDEESGEENGSTRVMIDKERKWEEGSGESYDDENSVKGDEKKRELTPSMNMMLTATAEEILQDDARNEVEENMRKSDVMKNKDREEKEGTQEQKKEESSVGGTQEKKQGGMVPVPLDDPFRAGGSQADTEESECEDEQRSRKESEGKSEIMKGSSRMKDDGDNKDDGRKGYVWENVDDKGNYKQAGKLEIWIDTKDLKVILDFVNEAEHTGKWKFIRKTLWTVLKIENKRTYSKEMDEFLDWIKALDDTTEDYKLLQEVRETLKVVMRRRHMREKHRAEEAEHFMKQMKEKKDREEGRVKPRYSPARIKMTEDAGRGREHSRRDEHRDDKSVKSGRSGYATSYSRSGRGSERDTMEGGRSSRRSSRRESRRDSGLTSLTFRSEASANKKFTMQEENKDRKDGRRTNEDGRQGYEGKKETTEEKKEGEDSRPWYEVIRDSQKGRKSKSDAGSTMDSQMRQEEGDQWYGASEKGKGKSGWSYGKGKGSWHNEGKGGWQGEGEGSWYNEGKGNWQSDGYYKGGKGYGGYAKGCDRYNDQSNWNYGHNQYKGKGKGKGYGHYDQVEDKGKEEMQKELTILKSRLAVQEEEELKRGWKA